MFYTVKQQKVRREGERQRGKKRWAEEEEEDEEEEKYLTQDPI